MNGLRASVRAEAPEPVRSDGGPSVPDRNDPKRRKDPKRRRGYLLAAALVAPGALYLLLVFCSIVLLLLSYSFRTERTSRLFAPFDTGTWNRLLHDAYTADVLWTTLRVGATVAVLTVLIAYPVAWCLLRIRRWWLSGLLMFVVFSPILISVVVRSYGWILLLAPDGLLHGPLGSWLYHEPGVVLALVHVELPFAIVPLLGSIRSLPDGVLEAAADLGASPWRRLRSVLLPLTMPGVIASLQLVFALTVSAFATPSLLGGGRVAVLAQSVYQNIQQLQWPLAAAQALVLLGVALTVLATFNRLGRLADVRHRLPAAGQGEG
ncbi:ABC transporter permease [Streptomyces paludis]|uniref:ABC transporter permease n=1 Tax=Streptomyces paludis TaxID=2282738 RepID=A0A345HYS0_9ACTN|nr:ABC transporter permease [Streptomyces paludis]AXG81844.1 ABC transporter permease [Streptomyces paludis]